MEKVVQIGLMGEIYSKAEWVFVWLGKEADGSEVAMDFLTPLYEELPTAEASAEGVEALRTKLGVDIGDQKVCSIYIFVVNTAYEKGFPTSKLQSCCASSDVYC